MLSCLAGKKIINTIDYNHDDIRKWSNKGILKCPVCESKVGFRSGMIRIPHFYHIEKDDCDLGYWENETKSHYLGKIFLYKWVKQLEYVKNVNIEYWIKETKQRPDIYFELGDKKHVIEFQCSNTTLEKFLDRRKQYDLMGISDIWVFGTDFNIKKFKTIDKNFMQEHGKAYYLSPFKKSFITITKGNRKKYFHNMSNFNNFFIDSGVINVEPEINSNFNEMKDRFLSTISKKSNVDGKEVCKQNDDYYFSKKQSGLIAEQKFYDPYNSFVRDEIRKNRKNKYGY